MPIEPTKRDKEFIERCVTELLPPPDAPADPAGGEFGGAGLRDVLDGGRPAVHIGKHGLVALVDVMPRMVPEGRTADYAVAQAARTSYGLGLKSPSEDRDLIHYLFRHRHTSPFEMCELKFHMKLPVFVARQVIRHRTASVNEFSARYAELPDHFYVPPEDSVRAQSRVNRQGGDEPIDHATAQDFAAEVKELGLSAYAIYKEYLAKGVSRELARMLIPLNVYTQWYWKIDLHNFFHFCGLRLDPHAQAETREFAEAAYGLVRPIFPVSCEAFDDYRLETVTMSRLDRAALAELHGASFGYMPDRVDRAASSVFANNRERAEFKAKLERLGLTPKRSDR